MTQKYKKRQKDLAARDDRQTRYRNKQINNENSIKKSKKPQYDDGDDDETSHSTIPTASPRAALCGQARTPKEMRSHGTQDSKI